MPRASDSLALSPDQRRELERWVVALGTPQQVALRCRIILAVADGRTEMAIASENGVNRKTVRLWRERFRNGGPQSLWEIASGRGRKPSYDAARIKAVIDASGEASFFPLVIQKLCRHHRRQRQRNNAGNENCSSKRECKFAEERSR